MSRIQLLLRVKTSALEGGISCVVVRCFGAQLESVKQILGGFFIAIYRIICMKRPEIAMSLYRQREITNQLFFLELLSLIFFLELFYLGASMTGTEPVMEFLRGHSMTMDHILKQASGSSEWEIEGKS